MTDREVFEKLAEVTSRGTPVCLATIIDAQGSTPREVGAKMLVFADGTTYGSIGGGCGESQVRSAVYQCLLVWRKPLILEIDLTDDLGTRGGDVCGGRMWVNVEPYGIEAEPDSDD